MRACFLFTKAGVLAGAAFCLGANAASVLFIGDSLSASKGIGLGAQVDVLLRKQGHSVQTVAACGSSPANYTSSGKAQTRCGYFYKDPAGNEDYLTYQQNKNSPHDIPKLTSLLKKEIPNLVVIQQGTNVYEPVMRQPPKPEILYAQVTQMLQQVYDQASGAKCLWVMPPKITRYDGKTVSEDAKNLMAATIRRAIKDYSTKIGRTQNNPICEDLDSREYTKNPDGGDGTHFSSSNPDWVNATMKKIGDLLPGGQPADKPDPKDKDYMPPTTPYVAPKGNTGGTGGKGAHGGTVVVPQGGYGAQLPVPNYSPSAK